jgi:hypothetical protein
MDIKGQLPINAMAAHGKGAPAGDVPELTRFAQALTGISNGQGSPSGKAIIPASSHLVGFTETMSMKDLSLNDLVELLQKNSTLKQLSVITNP